MNYKVCYVTTLPSTIESFILKSAMYNIEHGGWDTSVICDSESDFSINIPPSIKYIPVKIKWGISLSGIISTYNLYKVFKKEKFDLVQYSTTNASCYASIAAKMAKVPIRLYCQWGLGYVQRKKSVKRVVEKTLERVICLCSTNVQPDSFGNMELAIKEKLYDYSKGEVIGHGSACGIDLTKFDIANKLYWRRDIRNKYSISDNEFVFGYVGRMIKDKGINELIEAFDKLSIAHKKVRLLLIGNDQSFDGIDKSLLMRSKANCKVIFTGKTTVVEQFLSALDCFVFPSYHEGFGMATIEAESMGLPVIGTDIPGTREAMQDGITGILVPIKDVDSLMKAMEKIMLDCDMRKNYANNAYLYVVDNFEQNSLLEKIFENKLGLLEKVEKNKTLDK